MKKYKKLFSYFANDFAAADLMNLPELRNQIHYIKSSDMVFGFKNMIYLEYDKFVIDFSEKEIFNMLNKGLLNATLKI